MADHQRNETAEDPRLRDRRLRESKQREHKQDYTGPVKQFVRKHAWVPAAQSRHEIVRDEGREHLRYFTLCAEEAIDVRLFRKEKLVESDGRGYPDIVFCEHFPDQYAVIAESLGRTRGFLADFKSLVLDRNEPKSEDFYSELPFDVYNLDFTGMCFPRGDPPFSRTLDAIVSLVDELGKPRYQKGFDIFLTFRADRSNENEEAIKQLKGHVRENKRERDWFRNAFVERYEDVGRLLDSKYHEFLLLTLPKLFGSFGMDAGFRVTCPYRLYYQRPNPPSPPLFYMISFVLSFDWVKERRKSLQRLCSRQEILLHAYTKLLQQLFKQDITNVNKVQFDYDLYEQEVKELLALSDEEF